MKVKEKLLKNRKFSKKGSGIKSTEQKLLDKLLHLILLYILFSKEWARKFTTRSA